MAREEISDIYCWKMTSEELTLYLASSGRGALRVGLSLHGELGCLAYFREIFPEDKLFEDYDMNSLLIDVLEAALNNRPAWRDIPLDLACTPFQRKAWEGIALIPYAQTRTYGEVARMIGSPKAARAVGQAMGKNPLPLVFP